MNSSPLNATTTNNFMYVASYTYPYCAPGSSSVSTAKGISVYKILKDGSHQLKQVIESENPSFITVNKDQTALYCVNELGIDDSSLDGRVSAYRIDPVDGSLSFINTQPTHGNWPCHCSVHPSGKFLLSANYGSGNFVVHPILSDSSLGELVDQHLNSSSGVGADVARQSSSHPHMISSNPSNEYVYGVDLGTDQINAWSLDTAKGKLIPAEVSVSNVASGSGPRHMTFHPNNRYSYVLNELSSTLDVFDFDSNRGSMICKQSISLMPTDTDFARPNFDPNNPGFIPEGTNTGGAICIDDEGAYLYASNRGMNTIVTYKVNSETGRLVALDWVSTRGKVPRGMQINENYLYVGNQDSNSIIQFEINRKSGLLDGKSTEIKCPVPTDFAFAHLGN
ncbi:lactonase family protein [Vibrio breoganii]|uniref:lactonase family protein n=1 Tax=Vibrio breoganii TaxID=553239 RepID=UPI000C82772A|nr:lactonase family protein [Vibrio breoganii]PMO32028.1 hypothetical protein BCT12_17005 [Vibrio breoganii]